MYMYTDTKHYKIYFHRVIIILNCVFSFHFSSSDVLSGRKVTQRNQRTQTNQHESFDERCAYYTENELCVLIPSQLLC